MNGRARNDNENPNLKNSHVGPTRDLITTKHPMPIQHIILNNVTHKILQTTLECCNSRYLDILFRQHIIITNKSQNRSLVKQLWSLYTWII